MIELINNIYLPQIWGAIIIFAIITYVILDGFDLGIGILFPFAPTIDCKDKMMNSIAPFWDGNETWLVLGGGGLLAAFPKAFSMIGPALYLPISYMVIALVFRGVAFEFRFKSERTTKFWDITFHFGSLVAAFMQGIILGGIIQGIKVENGIFVGATYDWLTPFSLTCGLALVFGYSLLGSTWLIYKTSDQTQNWARSVAKYVLLHVVIFLGIISLWTPQLDQAIFKRWFSMPSFMYLSVIPVFTLYVIIKIIMEINAAKHDVRPFVLTIILFILGFIGLVVSIWPYIVPRTVTFTEAAANPKSLSLMLIGAVITVPMILLYTGYNYYVFRGKATSESMYHH